MTNIGCDARPDLDLERPVMSDGRLAGVAAVSGLVTGDQL